MDISWLQDFLSLAMEGSFSRAAETRNSSQPAFSRRIKALEDWLGAILIDRDTHRIALTEAGTAFRRTAEEVLGRLSLGRDEARDIGANQANSIRFAATQALAVTFFPQLLRAVEDQSDFGTISLIADNMEACERVMVDGRADFLLCHHHLSATSQFDDASFQSVLLGLDQLVPVSVPEFGRPRYELPGDPKMPLPYIEFDEKSGMGRILDAAGIVRSGRAALRTVFRSHLASGLVHMARSGMGVAWVPLSLCRQDLNSGLLVSAGDVSWSVPIEIRLFRPKSRRNSAGEAFWKLVSTNWQSTSSALIAKA